MVPVRLDIEGLKVGLTLQPDADGRAEVRLDVQPRCWSPESPRLYPVTLRAGEDEVCDRIGCRRSETQGTESLGNGEPGSSGSVFAAATIRTGPSGTRRVRLSRRWIGSRPGSDS